MISAAAFIFCLAASTSRASAAAAISREEAAAMAQKGKRKCARRAFRAQ